MGGRDDDDSIGVGDHEIARPHSSAAHHCSSAKLPEVILPGAYDGDARGEDREAQQAHRVGVTHTAVDDEARDAACSGSDGEHFTPVSVLGSLDVDREDAPGRCLERSVVEHEVVASAPLDSECGP